MGTNRIKQNFMTEETMKKIVYTIVFLLGMGMLITVFSSCTTSGYGCHGRSKYITGYKPDKWEMKYYHRK